MSSAWRWRLSTTYISYLGLIVAPSVPLDSPHRSGHEVDPGTEGTERAVYIGLSHGRTVPRCSVDHFAGLMFLRTNVYTVWLCPVLRACFGARAGRMLSSSTAWPTTNVYPINLVAAPLVSSFIGTSTLRSSVALQATNRSREWIRWAPSPPRDSSQSCMWCGTRRRKETLVALPGAEVSLGVPAIPHRLHFHCTFSRFICITRHSGRCLLSCLIGKAGCTVE